MINTRESIALLIFAASSLLMGRISAAELQARTVDGQTLQGEYIGTENNVVKLRSKYGVINIPSRDIVTLTAVAAPAKAKGDEAAATETAVAENALVFKEPKMPNLMSLVASRLADAAIGEPNKSERQELYRVLRNFGESSDKAREKIIRKIQDLGVMAYPYVAATYNQPFEIGDKVDLLRAFAVPDSPFTAGIFAEAHNTAVAVMNRIADAPPLLPPEYPSKREREMPNGKAQQLKIAATDVLLLEGYSSISGGPFNALFLLDVYRSRYDKNSTDALLNDIARDSARFADTGSDALRSNSSWTAADRLMIAEQVLPLLFKDNEDYKTLAREMLKKILPPAHPKFDAPESTWFEWWQKHSKQK